MPKIIIDNSDLIKITESCTVILKNSVINIEYSLSKDSNILIFSDYSSDISLNEKGNVINCICNINYLHLDNNNLIQNTKINVLYNATLNVNTTYLGINEKNIIFDLFNKENDSSVNITNNIVCLDKCIFSLDCIGTIIKGAKRSKCHQKSHCLTIENPIKAKVLPVLNIDENDVEASHSLSSGTIDEEILFYMNTRGLSSKQALNLVLKSYLMPSDEFYKDFMDGENIQNEAIRKVDQLCLM